MKREPLAALAAVLLVVSAGCGGKSTPTTGTTPSGTPDPQQPNASAPKSNVKVEIADLKVTINGTDFTLPTELAVLEKALGKPSSVTDNPVLENVRNISWSEFGVSCEQERMGKQLVTDVRFNYEPAWDSTAMGWGKPFTGELILRGQPITRSTKLAELGQKIKLEKTFGDSWRFLSSDGSAEVGHINFKEGSVETVVVVKPPMRN